MLIPSDVKIITGEHIKLAKHRLSRMRHFEILAEYILVVESEFNADALVEHYANSSRDAIVSHILDWLELRRINEVNCPVCWAYPKQRCRSMPKHYLKESNDLPRMYHTARQERADRKLGAA